ncbi:hypothetical protein [Streptomyces clavuligerus]|uniref:hypothetical protein n=1 Tax=Streptomyces clavuligerus TaxID=1901 RepID=UPI000180089F|nr:hypothetical protein [Streptomyces clavuligerus]EDY52673.1 hypothetical protein SSCG_05716 [Streptomyces clavuligerus]WDN56039.1 hypothetical protein LL058_29590 [Streptomyces clavuligerus]
MARAACAADFLRARGGSLPRTTTITVLLGPDAHAVLTSLRSPHSAIASALTDRFLDRLPPQPPARPRLPADPR